MTHDEAMVLTLESFDRALTETEREVLQQHLDTCAACRSNAERVRAADSALGAWGAQRAPVPDESPVQRQPPVASPRAPWWPVAAAAAIAGIALGGLIGGAIGSRIGGSRGREVAAEPSHSGLPTFALFLEEPAGQWPPHTPLMRPGYFEWMDTLVARGQYAGGERLSEDAGRYLALGDTIGSADTTRAAAAVNFSGLFLIHARDYDDAVRIARGSPHLRHGGVLVRRTY